MKKVLIIGGVAAGASAATRLRRLDENLQIVMFERGEHISFANCGLPYYIGDVISDREKLLVATPKLMVDRFNIDVRISSEVTGINVHEKKVKVVSKEKGVYEEVYDYLVLAPGAKPIRPNIPGISSSRIFTLRNVNDTDLIKSKIQDIKSATIIGGGYIGVEMAENLRIKGIETTLVEAAPHILAPFDDDMVVVAEKKLKENGIKLILNNGVEAFNDQGNQVEIVLESGERITSDCVILAVGVAPDTGFLKDSSIQLSAKGHILVNNKMETNIKGIYAGGDAVEVIDFVNGTQTAIPLAGPANKQGRIIADNISGLSSTYKNTQGTSVIKIFDLTCAATGNNEKVLKRLDIPYKSIIIHPNSYAGYYPGAQQLTLKLIFNDAGKILGAQALGYIGVEKRIDVIATALRLGGTVYDLMDLELSYAPPFGSAKDPVNFAGYVAENVLTGKSDIIHPREIENILGDDNIIILDVRSQKEHERGNVEGSIHIDVNDLRNHIDKLDKSKEYWLHCGVGVRSYIAERILKQNGFKCKNITGGYKSIEAIRNIINRKE